MSLDVDDPPNSRLFVVAGRATSADFLREVFEQFGNVSFVKYLRDKGVAYVKYDRASSAALAIENLHEVTLNDGRGPRLKVILAESPHMRNMPLGLAGLRGQEDASLDPDNSPPRSRLFLVVPKSADGAAIEAEMARFPDMQYCKTDLVASKGIVFVKYARSSSAAAAMEAVQAGGQVAGYRVKCMLAEPKVRRSSSASPASVPGRAQATPPPPHQGSFLTPPRGLSPFPQHQAALQALLGSASSAAAAAAALHPLYGQGGAGVSLLGTPGASLAAPGAYGLGLGGAAHGFAPDAGLGGLGFSDAGLPRSQYVASASHEDLLSAGVGYAPLDAGVGAPLAGGFSGAFDAGPGFLSPPTPSLSASSSTSQLSRQRLFVVLHKSVSEETLACLFRSFSGMEYCDLKRDRATGRSKGYAYVKYVTHEAAASAQQSLNGAEFPPGSGCRMKVMFAETAAPRARSGSVDSGGESSTPYGRGAPGADAGLGPAPDTAGSSASTHAPRPLGGVFEPFARGARAATPPARALGALGSPLSADDGTLPRRAGGSLFSPGSGLSASTPDLLVATERLSGLRLDHGLLPPAPGMGAYALASPGVGAAAARAGTPMDGDAERAAGEGLYGDRAAASLASPGTTLTGSTWGHELSPESALSAGASAATTAAGGLRYGGPGATPTSKPSAGAGEKAGAYAALPPHPLPDYALSHVFSR